MGKTANRQPKPCRVPGCGKLTFSRLCLDCRRKAQLSPVGICRHCGQRIYEPFSTHLDKCEAYRTWSRPAQNTKEAQS